MERAVYCSLLIAAAIASPVANATIPDGIYQSTSVTGQYEAFVSPGPGTCNSPFTLYSGGTITVIVNGLNVTFTLDKAGEVTYSGSGTQSASTLDLTGTGATLTGTPSGTSAPTADSINYTVSGSNVLLPGGFNFFGQSGTCDNIFIDAFSLITLIFIGGIPATGGETTSTDITNVQYTEILAERWTGLLSHHVVRWLFANLFDRQRLDNGGDKPQPSSGPKISARAAPTDSGFALDGATGLSAGDGSVYYGTWGSYTYSDFENDFAGTAYDGNGHLVMAGVDASPWEGTLFGIAFGYESSDIDTSFNAGNQETDGFTIAPYFGALLTDTWSVDFSLGYSNLDTDQFRTAPGTTTRIRSSPNSDRWFGALNLSGMTAYNDWIIGGRLGLLYAQNEQDAYVESDGTARGALRSEIGQWNISGDVAYSYGEFEPFARATYAKNFKQTDITIIGGPQPSSDDDDVMFGAGVRYFGTNGITANFEWNKRLGRDDFDEDTYTFTIRSEF